MRGPQEPWPAWMQEFVDVDGPKSRRGRVAAGELVDIATLAALLGWSVESVAAAEKQGRLFSIEADGIRYFPRFFADAGVDRRALELVFRLLAPLGSWSAYHFLMSRKVSLRAQPHLKLCAKVVSKTWSARSGVTWKCERVAGRCDSSWRWTRVVRSEASENLSFRVGLGKRPAKSS